MKKLIANTGSSSLEVKFLHDEDPRPHTNRQPVHRTLGTRNNTNTSCFGMHQPGIYFTLKFAAALLRDRSQVLAVRPRYSARVIFVDHSVGFRIIKIDTMLMPEQVELMTIVHRSDPEDEDSYPKQNVSSFEMQQFL